MTIRNLDTVVDWQPETGPALCDLESSSCKCDKESAMYRVETAESGTYWVCYPIAIGTRVETTLGILEPK